MTLRIGVLGAARITPSAVVRPARLVDGVEIAAVAARDRARAEKFAAKHGIARVHGSYADLLADPDIDAVYNPLPNGLHGRWTIAAIEAGKHVLCEKPFTANGDEARAVAAVAKGSDRVVMEAFHWRYHPMTARTLEIIASGEIGAVRHIETRMCIPLLLPGDIRWDLALAGGTLMDVGCYALHQLRTYAGAEPAVVSAEAKLLRPGMDRWVRADLQFGDGRTGRIVVSMLSARLVDIGARIVGSDGSITVRFQTIPQILGRIRVAGNGRRRSEKAGEGTSYLHQLRAFVGAVAGGTPFPTTVDNAIVNMDAIDAVYRAAGLEPRQPTP